ncbi:MafI family immunity protein [Kitasatospora mediocidica]|uniref:MafI family immunity protein n=1 Tax=Kitasatospora mediocidica TaxID=58352 RepID=UPI000563A86D|nr:MafI family immunity protein [Kitasatospora mediocidica]
MMVEKKLRELATMVGTHVPAHAVQDYLTFVEANEAELGLGILCDFLSDEEESLTSEEVELIRELTDALGLPARYIEVVEELRTAP